MEELGVGVTCASKPYVVSVCSSNLPTTTAPSAPALLAIVLHGTVRALRMMSTPTWAGVGVGVGVGVRGKGVGVRGKG